MLLQEGGLQLQYEQHLFTLGKGRIFGAMIRVVLNSSFPKNFLAAPQIHS